MELLHDFVGTQIVRPDDIARIITSLIEAASDIDREKEHFWSIGLNTKNRIKYIELVSLGTLNNAIVHQREIFRLAIMKAVNSIVVAHNHPSGDPSPSREDIAITETLKKAGDVLGIQLRDHVIVGSGDFRSMLALGNL